MDVRCAGKKECVAPAMDVRASMARDVQCKHVSNLHVILHNRHRQLGSHRIMDSLDRDGDGEAVLALPLPFYIYIVKSVLVVLIFFFFLFHFFVIPGDTTGTLYLQVTINAGPCFISS